MDLPDTTPTPARAPPRERRALLAILASALACELVALSRMSLAALVQHVPDDSFFYLIVGERLRESGAFSFDGEHPTYGFQPSYQWLAAALAYAFRDPVDLLRAALVLGSLTHVACAWLLFGLVRDALGRFAAWAAVVFWVANPALVGWFWSVKENGLYALFLLWTYGELARAVRSGAARPWHLGLALAATALARVNFLLLWPAAAAVAWLAPGGGRRQRLRDLALATAWACAVAAPWFVYARLRFGSAMPTSGMVKIASGEQEVARELGLEWLSAGHLAHAARTTLDYLDRSFRSGSGGFGPILQGLALAAVAGWLWSCARRRTLVRPASAPAAALLGVAAACAVANAYLNALLLPQFLLYGQWYTAPEFVALALGVGWIVALARAHLASARGALVLALGLALGVVGWTEVRRVPWSWRAPEREVLERRPHGSAILLEAGLWARDHLPPDARAGIRDPGIVTYFSRRRLVPLDPLVQSREFILGGRRDLPGFVRENRLSYVMGAGVRRDGRYRSLVLPEGSYDVVWVPYPEVDLGWIAGEPSFWMLVRPRDTPGPDFLGPADFEFGAYRPDAGGTDALAPLRAERAARAREDVAIDGDVLRVHVDAGPNATARLWIDGELEREATPGRGGWIDWDVSAHRGRRARVEIASGSLFDARFVDLSFGRARDR
jgi:hypothetical protein